jgi:transcriptional regulator with XRE-family HTH domain
VTDKSPETKGGGWSIKIDLPTKLRDPEYRRKFFWAETSAKIADQLVKLRKRRDVSQKELADQLGTKQPAISRAERADYQNWNLNTLRSIADALNARLRVLIEPTEDIIDEYAETEEQDAGLVVNTYTDGVNIFSLYDSIYNLNINDIVTHTIRMPAGGGAMIRTPVQPSAFSYLGNYIYSAWPGPTGAVVHENMVLRAENERLRRENYELAEQRGFSNMAVVEHRQSSFQDQNSAGLPAGRTAFFH